MALTLKEKLELQKTAREGREKLHSGQVTKLGERLAIQREVRLALDKLKGTSTPLPEEPKPPTSTGMTEEYRKLLAGEYNGLTPNSFKQKARLICGAEAAAYFAVNKEPPTYGDLSKKTEELMREPVAQYLKAHYNAEKDVFEHKAA